MTTAVEIARAARAALRTAFPKAKISVSSDGLSCWTWNGHCRKEDGRAVQGRGIYVYRLLYSLLRGPIPRGSVAHHRCEHPWCVNPWHIELMSRGNHLKEHGLLSGDWGQRNKTHCPAGHPYDESNTYRWKGERQCRACRVVIKARYRARLRQTRLAAKIDFIQRSAREGWKLESIAAVVGMPL